MDQLRPQKDASNINININIIIITTDQFLIFGQQKKYFQRIIL